ncbi:MAG: hypothetical protein AMJ62_13555 [Myxococcales bacterium SG8_38]|nr:MAG: hypothetical protein AMJ62_13555 [Myxococcales bacterium SG8_38]
MVRAKAAAAKRPKNKPTVEELYFRSDSAYLCLLVNRRNRSIRVIDFRAGALPAKRLYIQSVATQENIDKVITLVEKDEVSSWTRVGFVREGTIPGFYKRSDGHLCGCVIGDKTASVEVSEASSKLAERTINAAKKAAKDIPEKIKGATVRPASEKDALAARDAAWRKGPTLGSFDIFGRDAERIYYDASVRRSKTNYVSAEFQDCFGHALVEVLRTPTTENETLAVLAGLQALGTDLEDRGIVAAFAFAPNDNVEISTAYLGAGYRKTGLLAQGVLDADGNRKDAILWTRKLANPLGEDYE